MSTARDQGINRLYNYQTGNLSFLEGILRDRRIHCSNPANFNDPWDCKPYFDASSVQDPAQRRKWIAFFKEQFAGFPKDEQAKILHHFGLEWFENSELLRRSVESTTKAVWKNNEERFRVFCLTTKPNSLLMWSHYADKHQGFCLEFDATKEKIWRARRVVYRDALPVADADVIRDGESLVEAALLTKSTEWSYEEEYRLLGRERQFDAAFSLATDGNFLALPDGAITAVIAGSRAKVEAIREIVKRVAPGVPFKRAIQKPNEYHLSIIDDEG